MSLSLEPFLDVFLIGAQGSWLGILFVLLREHLQWLALIGYPFKVCISFSLVYGGSGLA